MTLPVVHACFVLGSIEWNTAPPFFLPESVSHHGDGLHWNLIVFILSLHHEGKLEREREREREREKELRKERLVRNSIAK